MRISVTKLKQFKACRRSYEFKYIECLEPVQKSEALETGANYHKKLEELYATGQVDTTDLTKESAMAVAYKRFIYPKFKMVSTEDWIEMDFNGHTLVGRVDGISDDRCLVEHKTTSANLDEEYEYNLQWDEQILAYMLLANTRKIYYTVCKKPTIRQKQNETDVDFFNRMVDWYNDETTSKIKLLTITRTDEEVEDFAEELKQMLKEMEDCTHFYKNTLHCFRWGRQCEYASICLNYDRSQNYIEFERRNIENENSEA